MVPPTGRGSGRFSCPIAREAQRPVRQCPAWVEPLSGQSSGTARPAFERRSDRGARRADRHLAYAVRNAPVARPEERVGAVCGVGRDARVHLRQRHRRGRVYERHSSVSPQSSCSWRRRRNAVLADVMDTEAPVVAPGTHQERAAWLASKRGQPGQRIQPLPSPNPPQRLAGILLLPAASC